VYKIILSHFHKKECGLLRTGGILATYRTGQQVVFKDGADAELLGIKGIVVTSRRIRGHYVYEIEINMGPKINIPDNPFTSQRILTGVPSSWIEPLI
jgi:hypothetical protein